MAKLRLEGYTECRFEGNIQGVGLKVIERVYICSYYTGCRAEGNTMDVYL
jgi:hypothetical protein